MISSTLYYLIYSHRGQYGVTNVGKQSLTLLEVSAYNERVFDNSMSLLSLLIWELIDCHLK